jgi:predicted dehydrogenase
MQMTMYKVGVIGCGRIASLLEQERWRGNPNTHAGCYDHCPRTRIIAAADADGERRGAFGRRWGVGKLYESWEAMLGNEDLEIVSVATYPIPHRDMVVAAASSGVRAIFCEKAMATTLREADEMIAACEARGIQLTINHGRRWDRQYHAVKRLLDEGHIGELQAITLHFSAGLANNGTHYFDMLRHFAGDVAWATGHLADAGSLDPAGSGSFFMRGGVRCLVNGVSGRNAASLFELMGSAGRVTISEERPPQFRLFVAEGGRMKEQPFPNVPENERINTFGAGRCVLPASVEDIVDSLERRAESLSTGRDGRAALEMVLALHESERLGNARVDLPLENRDLRVLVRPEGFMSSAKPES